LPIGTIEVHGPNLPFATDSYLVEAFASKLKIAIDCIILPSVYYSFAGVTKKIKGTISIPIGVIEIIFMHL